LTTTTFAVGTNIEIHNNGLLGEGKIDSFYLDVGRIVGNFHFPLFQWKIWRLISPVGERANFFFEREVGVGKSDS